MVETHVTVIGEVKKSRASKSHETDESYSEGEVTSEGGEDDELTEEEFSEQEETGKSAAGYLFWAPEAYYNTVIDKAIKRHRRKSGSKEKSGSRDNSGSREKIRTQKKQETSNMAFSGGTIPHFLSQRIKIYQWALLSESRKRKAPEDPSGAVPSKKKKDDTSSTEASPRSDSTKVPTQNAKRKHRQEEETPPVGKKQRVRDVDENAPPPPAINGGLVSPRQAPTNIRVHPPTRPTSVQPSAAPTPDSLPPLLEVADVSQALPPQVLTDLRPHSLAGDSLPRGPTTESLRLPPAVPNVSPPQIPTDRRIRLPPAGFDVPILPPQRSSVDTPLPPPYPPTTHAPTRGGVTSGNIGPLTVPGHSTTSGTTHTPTYRDIVEQGLARPFLQFVRECGFLDIPSDFSIRQEFVSTFLKVQPELRGSTDVLPSHATYTVAAIYHLRLQDSFHQWLQTVFGLDWVIGNYVVKCNFATAFLLEESCRRPGLWADIPDHKQFHASLERMVSVL